MCRISLGTKPIACMRCCPRLPRAPLSSGRLALMTKTLLSAIAATALAGAVVSAAGIQAQHAGAFPLRPFAGARQVLLPVSGAWSADYERNGAQMIQVLTTEPAAVSAMP